jgi:hypothetical protein
VALGSKKIRVQNHSSATETFARGVPDSTIKAFHFYGTLFLLQPALLPSALASVPISPRRD